MVFDLIDRLPTVTLSPPQGRQLKALPIIDKGGLLETHYNGFSPIERKREAQMIGWLKRMGLMPWPKHCSVCGRSGAGIDYHGENYYNPLQACPICKGCHMRIHKRFKDPDPFRALVEKHADGTKWFEALALTPISMAGYLRRKYGDGVRDLWNSPLFTIPDWVPRPVGDLAPLTYTQEDAREQRRLLREQGVLPPMGTTVSKELYSGPIKPRSRQLNLL